MKQNIREIKIEDLLSRDEIKIGIKEIQENFISKVVMVTLAFLKNYNTAKKYQGPHTRKKHARCV